MRDENGVVTVEDNANCWKEQRERQGRRSMQLIVNWLKLRLVDSGYWDEVAVEARDKSHVAVSLFGMDELCRELVVDVLKGCWLEDITVEGDSCIVAVPGVALNFAHSIVEEIENKLFNEAG